LVSLLGFHAPHPHHVAVGVTGPGARQVTTDLAQSAPGAYDTEVFTTTGAASHALAHGRVYAVVETGPTTTIRYAGAQGPTVFAALVATLVPAVARATHARPAVIDALPLRPDDAAGLPLFYLAFGLVLSSYLFAVTTTALGRTLGPWGHWTSAGALAVALGLLGALVARFGTHTIGAHTAMVVLVLVLTSLGTGAGAFLLLRLSTTLGSVLGTIVLVILGSSSGGVVPGPFLPPWLGVLRGVLPLGVCLTTVRNLTYFASRDVGRSILVLTAWALLPLLLVQVLDRSGARRPVPATNA
jgi:hypothetical protein